MLDSLLIRNFRLFKEFRMERLNRVNLFVGKNNSGKSSLLEALQVYASNRFPSALLDLVFGREEDWEDSARGREIQPVAQSENPFRYLFYGYHFPEVEGDGIEVGPETKEADRIHIRLRAYQLIEDQNGSRRRVPVSPQEIQLEGFEIGLERLEGNQSSFLHPLSDHLRAYRGFMSVRSSDKFRYNLQSIPAYSLNDLDVATLWDKINLTDLESKVVSCLQIIEPSVKQVALVGESPPRNRRLPIVRLKDSTERIPLKSLGDGMVRLLHISLALVNARDGFLLIDEFENGIHWTVHPKLWEMIFQVAEKLNVQVFATTHSRDCVRGFYEVWSKQEEKGSFHRLDPDPEMGVRSTSYTCDILSDALETGVEVR